MTTVGRELSISSSRSEWRLRLPLPLIDAARLAIKHPLGVFGALCVLLIVLVAILAPLITSYDPTDASYGILQKPSESHFLGTDRAGRDVLSRVVWGSRTSLTVGAIVATLGAMLATLLGLIAGYFQRWPDYLIQRGSELFSMMPDLLILFLFVFAFGPGFNTLVVALSVVGAFAGVRVIRSAALSEKQNQYVEAARSLGAGHLRILLRHILPNLLPLAIVLITTRISSVILAEASLSFLGLGVPPPNPSWGADIGGQARTYFRAAPWLALAPGIALSLAVLGTSLMGDALRDILDPRLRGRR
ncbi:MAG: ABC transporter permease [Chloroflexota bacterium]|nr:MAG: ABC transporter permease [Chloroflexota bacterium]